MDSQDVKLKLEIISKISNLKEDLIIEEIKHLLDFELDEGVFELTTKQRARISKRGKNLKQ